MSATLLSPAARLFNAIRRAFEMRSAVSAPAAARRFGDADTGAKAKMLYLTRHPTRAGAHGSIVKLQRAARIDAGLRPLKFDTPTKRERIAAAKAALSLSSDGDGDG